MCIFLCAVLFHNFVTCCVMHVTCMDNVDRIRGDNEAMHSSIRREWE
jgi:hypothetical protein